MSSPWQTPAPTTRNAENAPYRVKVSGGKPVAFAKGDGRAEGPETQESPRPAAAPAPWCNASTTVLVVDDDAASRTLCRRALVRQGYQVREAVNGQAALDEVRRQAPDVIVMDVTMPVMDGLECTRRLKAAPATANIPVIILSACDTPTDIEAGLMAGADEYLVKPVQIKDLRVRVRSMARLRQTHKAWLRATEAEMARKVLEAELAERRRVEVELRSAKERAEAGNIAKSEFLAMVSHELRTPLNGVIGMTQLLLTTPLDGEQHRFVTIFKHAADSLLSLINDILDYSKIEADRLELEAAPFEIPELIANVKAMFAPRAAAKGLAFTCGVHPHTPPKTIGDLARLEQVLTNLTANAIKFTESGNITVRAVVDDEGDHNVTVRFTVNDTGVGIPAGRLDRLFMPFSQVDASTTRRFGGTGLGLAICKKLVERMDGRIGVVSEPELGSTFWFTVRLKKADDDAGLARLVACDLRRLRLLVVSPNEERRHLVCELLANTGIHVEEAVTGREGLERLHSAARGRNTIGMAMVDAAITDMPAARFAGAAADDPRIRNTTLILLGSEADLRDVDGMRSAGFSGAVTLPLDRAGLLDAITSALACALSRWTPTGATSRSQDPSLEKTSAARGRILVAEDNEIGQVVVVEALKRGGYDCDVVTDGAQAFQAVRDRAYELVLMDCMMPVMDGYEAARRIRAMEAEREPAGDQLPHIPIIALTANAISGDRERCLAAGMDDYASKPLDLKRLLQLIDSYLVRRGWADSQTDPARVDAAGASAEDAAERPSHPFDMESLLKRWGNDRKFAEDLIAKFMARTPADVEKLREAVAAHNAAEVQRTAHGIKGAAGYVSADRLREFAAQLESMAREGDLSGADACLRELDAELHRCAEQAPVGSAETEAPALETSA